MLQRLLFVLLFALTTPFCLDACNYSVKIEGDTVVCGDSQIVVYHAVSSDSNLTYSWSVEPWKGEILKGRDSSYVTVRWSDREVCSLTVVARDINNCTQNAEITVRINIRKTELTSYACKNYPFVLHAFPGYKKYEWRDLIRPQLGIISTDTFVVIPKVTANQYVFEVTAVDTVTGCLIRQRQSVIRSNNYPSPEGPTSICNYHTGRYTFSSQTGINEFEVKGGRVVTKDAGSVTVLWESVGDSNYIDFIDKTVCLGTFRLPVRVYDTASIRIIPDVAKGCVDQQSVFTVKNKCKSCGGQWKVLGLPNANYLGTADKLFVTWKESGKAYVIFEEYDGAKTCDMTRIDTLIFEVNKRPKPYVDGKSYSCQKDTVQFSSAGSEGASQYLWVFGDGDSSRLENPQHVFVSAGVYHVRLWAYTDQGCTSEYPYEKLVTIRDLPNADWSSEELKDMEMLFWTDDATGRMYTWDFGDGSTGYGSKVQHKYKNSGKYKVRLVISTLEGCDPAALQKEISVKEPVSIADISNNPWKVKIFPNPFSQSFKINYTLPTASDVRVKIFDLAGKELLNVDLGQNQAGANTYDLDAGSCNLQPGMYVLILQAGNMEYKQRLVKIPE